MGPQMVLKVTSVSQVAWSLYCSLFYQSLTLHTQSRLCCEYEFGRGPRQGKLIFVT